jgi:hypothetical protein
MPVAAVVLAALAALGYLVLPLDDPRLTEASGLVDLGAVMVTANDSGNAPLLFVVDARTGHTRRTIRYAATNTDTEALAPAGPRAVWVGDIGDNLARRPEVVVHRVPLDGGRIVTYRLRYADGPRDAESLFVVHDRLYVVSKVFLAPGAFYAAPARLHTDRVNVLRRVATGPPTATDAAAFPDGRHVLVRDYRAATLYAVPSFRALGSFPLPAQRQGEGISIGPGDRIRVSSEGVHSAVREVALPAALAGEVAPRVKPTAEPVDQSPASPSTSPSMSPSASPAGDNASAPDASWPPWLGGFGAVLGIGVVVGLWRGLVALRRRSGRAAR